MGAILDYILSIFDFIVNIFQSIIWFVTTLPQMLAILSTTFGYCPPFIQSFLILSMAATTLFAIIRLI